MPRALNDPIVDCCGRDTADCDCPIDGTRCLRCDAFVDVPGAAVIVFAAGRPTPARMCITHGGNGHNGLSAAEYAGLVAAHRPG